jgi:hypothetical protein
MPTGYTADIAKGITFEQYALACARAFGALILMRDDPSDAPIPERFEPSDYSVKALAEAKAELTHLDAMSVTETAAAADAEYAAETERCSQRRAEYTELRNKYNAMLAQVVQWEPPTPDHVKYKEFMVEQIRSSIDGDCNEKYITEPALLTGQQWLMRKITEARRSVAYHEKSHAEEIERTDNRNAWIKALRDSLATR